MAHTAAGKIGVDELADLVATDEIDTVITAVCDMQGRLVGKRVTGQFFVDHCREHGTHLCTYLLGTDMEMNTPDGYSLMNWESGYGDYLNRPDWSTLRVIPWLEKTALVLGDVVDEASGELVSVAPRTILRRQIERAAAMGLRPKMASELEFYLLRDTYEEAAAKGWDGLRPWGWYNEDYQLLQATKAEPIYRQFRNLMTRAGVPIEFSKGEAAPGQHEVNIHYDDALESADRAAIYKHGAKEIAHLNGCSITFMAKPDHAWTGSSSHVHMSLWDAAGETSLFADPAASDGMSQSCATSSAVCWPARASCRSSSRATSTPTSGTPSPRGPRSTSSGHATTAPAASASSATVRHCASKTDSPAATPTRTWPTPRSSPPACTASSTRSSLPRVPRQRLRGHRRATGATGHVRGHRRAARKRPRPAGVRRRRGRAHGIRCREPAGPLGSALVEPGRGCSDPA